MTPDEDVPATAPGGTTASESPPAASPSPPAATRTASIDATRSAAEDAVPVEGRPLRAADRYEILAEHGRGGRGRVSRARDHELERDVAIKELITRSHISELRFFREALITARLEHPGIVPVHEAGRWPDGTPFYAMKLVAGRPLRDLIAERRTVDERLGLLHHAIAVADAIAYAHDHNIIHRDLKPANVIVGDFGETVVIDWGLAKDLSASEESGAPPSASTSQRYSDLTNTGSVLGTPAYMAPEQARGEHVDQRADVFAIGAMLWELCCLQKVPPSDVRMRHRVLRRAGIDRDLVTIIDKSISPDPAHRYANASELAADLKAFKSGSRIAARTYSLPELLTHWMRRHRALTSSMFTIVVAFLLGIFVYIHNIALARDAASQERDRAELAEASLLLDKDPTAAKALLSTRDQRSPQQALLLSRAIRLAAIRTINIPGAVLDLHADSTYSNVAIYTSDGNLLIANTDTGLAQTVDHDLSRAVVTTDHGWIYARKHDSGAVSIVDTSTPDRPIETGDLFHESTAQLVATDAHLYARDTTSLYIIDSRGPTLVRSDVQHIAGQREFLLLCTTNNELIVLRNGTEVRRTRCAKNPSDTSMVVAGHNYAALLDPTSLLLVRGDDSTVIPVHIDGEYGLAISPEGSLALADLGGQTWFVRPGADRLEPGPSHPTSPISVTASGRYIAWGYADGTVVAFDLQTNTSWEFRGHKGRVVDLVIDARRNRLLSLASHELHVWQLTPPALHKLFDLPAKVFNLAFSPDHKRIAMDGADGRLRIWTPAEHRVTETSARHTELALSVAWLNQFACSGGFEGQVLCAAETGPPMQVLSGRTAVRWIIDSADHRRLFIATADGTVWSYDGVLRALYMHHAMPYRIALSADQQFIASGAADGSLIVYDYLHQQIVAALRPHRGLVTSVTWQGDDLWTTGSDGTVRQWHMVANELRPLSTTHETGVTRLFYLTKTGWVANVDGHVAHFGGDSASAQFRLDLEKHIEHINTSSDGRYVVVASTTELAIIDLVRRRIASIGIPLNDSGFVGFPEPGLLVVSTDHGFSSANLDDLQYIDF
jgi:serine/threonine protein kinase/WD40 repeat protein